MIQQLSQRFQQQKSRHISLIVILIGLMLSGLGAYKVRSEEEKKIQLTLQLRSLLISTTLERSVRSDFEALDTVPRVFQQSSNFSETEFQHFFETEFKNKPTIDALSWVPRITEQQRPQFEGQHRDRFPGIREINAQSILQNATTRPEYFPMLYAATKGKATSIIGLDLATSTTVATAMNQARDTGQSVATLAIDDPNQNDLDQLRLLVLTPVYDTPTPPEGLDARRQALAGFFAGELLIFNVVRGSFDELNMGGIDVFVTEEAEDTRLLHVHKKRNGEYVEGTLQELDATLQTQNIYANTSLEVSGNDWTLFFIPNKRFLESQRTQQWILVWIAGSISALTLGLYLKRQGDYATSTRALLNQLEDKNQCLATTLSDLKKTQTQAIQTEKLSALGRMVGGIAHEINNPVSFIFGNLKHLGNDFSDLIQVLQYYQSQPQPSTALPDELEDIDIPYIEKDVPKAITSMKAGANRIRDIVLALRTFSHLDESERKTINLHPCLDSTLVILEHRLHEKSPRPTIQITKIYGDLPDVDCLPGQLNQVFMHLLNNAIDALEDAWGNGKWEMGNGEKGTGEKPEGEVESYSVDQTPQIWIYTEANADNTVSIRVVDNGLGIPEDIRTKLFDPFFSTKPIGKGTGLGLAVSHQVVQRHGGTLTCNSRRGEKTEFVITMPLQMADEA
ncbi:MAG: CHASE domain-containing protein [Cyanobacteria bacterium P01_F01_bin.53]